MFLISYTFSVFCQMLASSTHEEQNDEIRSIKSSIIASFGLIAVKPSCKGYTTISDYWSLAKLSRRENITKLVSAMKIRPSSLRYGIIVYENKISFAVICTTIIVL